MLWKLCTKRKRENIIVLFFQVNFCAECPAILSISFTISFPLPHDHQEKAWQNLQSRRPKYSYSEINFQLCLIWQTALFCFLLQNGVPSEKNPYLFNGDFVDRGKNSMEILIILFAFLLVYPNDLHLNRGNHEDYLINLR